MKERPLLFSGPMVRATLAGTKTQTRRVVKPQPERRVGPMLAFKKRAGDGFWLWPNAREHIVAECPYGQPGARLWVRETFYAWGRWETRFSVKKGRDEWHFIDMTLEAGKSYLYAANGQQPQPMGGKRHKGGVTPTWWKRPAIFMPRWASRITLEVTGVRVERLQDISFEDCKSEGAWGPDESIVEKVAQHFGIDFLAANPYLAYRMLWESINGAGSWEANPWVWVVEFKRQEGGTA